MADILTSLVLLRIGSLGPHLLTSILAVGGVLALAWKAKLGRYEVLPFVAFAYMLHEAVFQNLFFLERYLQGYSVAASLFLSYVMGGATEISIGVIIATAYLLRKRLKASPYWVPFVALNVFWMGLGYVTSLPLGAGPSDSGSVGVSLLEETYTATFMLGLAGCVT